MVRFWCGDPDFYGFWITNDSLPLGDAEC